MSYLWLIVSFCQRLDCMLILVKGQSNEFISPFKVGKIDETSKDKDSIFVQISCEITSGTECRTILYWQLGPGQSTKIE